MQFVFGSEVDYVEGLQGAGFQVNNPNVVAACGCGSSFQVKEDAAEQAASGQLSDHQVPPSRRADIASRRQADQRRPCPGRRSAGRRWLETVAGRRAAPPTQSSTQREPRGRVHAIAAWAGRNRRLELDDPVVVRL